MRTKHLAIIAIALGLLGLAPVMALADTPDAGIVLVDAGTPVGIKVETTTTIAPADQLHDPVDSPKAAYDDAAAAFKTNWALGILAALAMLTRGLQTATARYPKLPLLKQLANHARAMLIIGAVATVTVDAYNALALGGSAWAVVFAIVMAVVALIDSPKPKAVQAAT